MWDALYRMGGWMRGGKGGCRMSRRGWRRWGGRVRVGARRTARGWGVALDFDGRTLPCSTYAYGFDRKILGHCAFLRSDPPVRAPLDGDCFAGARNDRRIKYYYAIALVGRRDGAVDLGWRGVWKWVKIPLMRIGGAGMEVGGGCWCGVRRGNGNCPECPVCPKFCAGGTGQFENCGIGVDWGGLPWQRFCPTLDRERSVF